MMSHCTRRLFLIALMTAPFFPAGAAEPKPARRNVVDYFLTMPPDRFEASPLSLLHFMQEHNSGGVIDKENGYLRCVGDGAQPTFEIALFRFRDDRPLLALCMGELEGSDSLELEFYVPGPKGKMQLAPRSIFPVADGDDRQFILPLNGRTIIVRDKTRKRQPGKHERRYVWDGERFAEQK